MAESHSIERKGMAVLVETLRSQRRVVTRSPHKRFDLLVDGVPAEVKCKRLPWARLDFIGFTDHQRDALRAGERFLLFIVCNLIPGGVPEIIELPSERLAEAEFRVESTHYLYGSQLRKLRRRGT